jgi:hypothetical protein
MGVLVLFFVVRAITSYSHFARVEREFDSIPVGESRLNTVSRLGKPNYDAGSCTNDMITPSPGCTFEYVYGAPLAPLIPDYYVVEFSSEDRVIDAGHLQSP